MVASGRNDPCWCGSGKKFKHCHLRRSQERPRPFRAILDEMRQQAAFRICLHPEASAETCGKVVSAHTLQRSRVLAAIAGEDNHVLTFFPFEPAKDGGITLHRRGWKRASVFEAFCDRHDGETFAPLEKVAYSGSAEQTFLLTYRAICWELYQKQRAINASGPIKRALDRGMPEDAQRRVQWTLNVQSAGFAKGLAEASNVKGKMDAAFLAQDFSIVEAVEFSLDGDLGIASTGAITPNRTLQGRSIQTLHDDSVPMEWLAFATDLRGSEPSMVFSWLKGESASQRYLEDIAALSPAERATFLAQFLFAHCENTYFSSLWWNGLSEGNKGHVKALASISNPYYFPPKYNLALQKLSPWRTANRV